MAKKIVTSGLGRKSNKSAVKQSSKSTPVQYGQPRSLTSDEIGHVAGEIWQLLNDQNGQSLASLKKSINAPDAVVPGSDRMAGFVKASYSFDTSGRNTKESLR